MKGLLLVLLAAAAAAAAEQGDGWFRSPPLLSLLVAGSERIADQACRNHSRLFLQHLDNYTLWAVQMLDASAKVVDGVLAGATYQLGHYDECLRVSAGDVRGQYCLLELTYRPLDYHAARTASPFDRDLDPYLNVWEKLKRTPDYVKMGRDVLHWALCLPASCRPAELQRVLDRELEDLAKERGLGVTAEVSPRMCSVAADPPPYTPAEIAFSVVVGMLILLVVTSTWYDVKKYSTEETKSALNIESMEAPLATRLWLCFSARRSVKSVLKTRVNLPALDCSNGPRFLFMILIMFGHRLIMYVGHPVDDATKLDNIFRDLGSTFIVNGTLLVDSYLVLSGFILAYQLLENLDKHNKSNLAQGLLLRYIRLTPTYMLVVFFHATLFYRLGSGPFWEQSVGTDRQRCQQNWWTNMLYVNNYVHVDGMCIFQSWYLSCDFQLCAVSLLLVYTIWRWPWLGYSALTVLCTASVVVPFLVVLLSRADAILIPVARHIQDPVNSPHFQDIYVKTHNRAAPYFVGVIVGLIVFKRGRPNSNLERQVTSHVLFTLLVWVLGSATMLSVYVFFDLLRPHSVVEAALYASLHRVGFGLSIACFFLLIAFGQLGIYERIFSWKPFKILSRLTYGAYLVHSLGQLYDQGSLRSPRPTTYFTVVWMTASDCLFAFGAAFVLLILVEAPFRVLEKLLLGKK